MGTEGISQALPELKGPLASRCCLMVRLKQRGSETASVTPCDHSKLPRSGAELHREREDVASAAPGASAEMCVHASHFQR